MMVAVSTRPLLYIFGLGLFITALSIVYHLYLVSDGLLFGGAVQAWHVVVASIWFAAGLVIMSAGVLGIYLSRVLAETRSRPATIVKHVYPRTTAGREELGSDDE
jgi:putative glycosyltransferase